MISYWEQSQLFDSDVIIIGAGIVGLSIASSLKERNANRSIRVLERSILPYGASTRNAGFACFGSLTEVLSDIEAMGDEAARQLLFDRWMGLQITRKRLGDDSIGFQQSGGYELLEEGDPRLDQLRTVNSLTEDFIPDYIEIASGAKESLGIVRNGVLVSMTGEGQIDSGRLMRRLYEYSTGLGVEILTGCHVNEVRSHQGGMIVQVNDQHRGTFELTSSEAIIAANGFSNQIKDSLHTKPARGQVFITKPIEGLKFLGNLHLDEGFYYLRNVDNRLLFGGARNFDFETEETNRMELNASIQSHLKDVLSGLLDLNVNVDMSWSGIMGFNENKKPMVERLDDRVVVATGMGGMGIALAGVIGEEVADLLEQ